MSDNGAGCTILLILAAAAHGRGGTGRDAMNEYTLLPCPFCGGEAELRTGDLAATVRCKSCYASIEWQIRPRQPGPLDEIDLAVGSWNARTHNARATFAGRAEPFISLDDLPVVDSTEAKP